MSFNFQLHECSIISDVYIFQPNSFKDLRGKLWSSFQSEAFTRLLNIQLNFNHDKFALNKKNVLRGIHGDFHSWKLVTVVSGSVFQVYVDNRKDSKTYLKHASCELDDISNKMILLPPGVGNGFLALTDNTIYNYKLSYSGEYKDFNDQFTLKWNDPELCISWPTNKPLLSNRDK